MSYKKFTKDIGMVGLTQLITALSGIIVLPVITKLLGAENYGVWTQLMVTLGLISPIAILGLPYTLVRFLAGEKDKREIQDGIWSVFTIIFCVSIIISLFLISFSIPISRLFNCDKVFVQILPFIIMFFCLNLLFSNIFRAFQQTKEYCFFSIFENLGETGLVILSIFLGYRLFGAVLSVLIMQFITFLIMGALIIKRIGIKIPQFRKIKNYLAFSLPNIMGDISFWVIQSSDKYFVGFFLGTLFVGYYAPAYTLGGVISFFLAPLVFLLPATLSKHYDENKID
jgi:O-antigen/teichoic acid export membrane protein